MKQDAQTTFREINKGSRTYITEGFRKAFKYGPRYREALLEARVEHKVFKKCGNLSKKLSVFYKCNECELEVKRDSLNVDHIVPVIAVHRTLLELTLDEYYRRVEYNKTQVLCKKCHTKKTTTERRIKLDIKKLRGE